MTITVICPSCLRRQKFAQNETGLSRKCVGCGTEITVPGELDSVTEQGPIRSRKGEFIIAGIILVVALVGAFLFLKWFQQNQLQSPPPRVSNRQTTEPVTTSKTPNTKKVQNPPVPMPLSTLLGSKEETQLGPATFRIVRIDTVPETPILKTRAASGQVFAVVGLEIKTVEPGSMFDTYRLQLVAPALKTYGAQVATGANSDGTTSEVPRKRVTSADVAQPWVKLDIYFAVPADLDPKTCQLVYR
jgi:hypothetical protein